MKNISIKIIHFKSIVLMLLLLFSKQTNAQQINNKIEYYSSAVSEFDGKIKSIDDIQIEYYLSAISEFNGKVKSIGNKTVEYYLSAISEFNGKIKSIGGKNVEYYLTAIPEINGKIKSIGSIKFEYNLNTSRKNGSNNKSFNNENDDPDSEDALDTYYLIEKLNRQ